MKKLNENSLVENKSVLAKLMASENINVRHRQLKTAYFDMQNRVLHCPIWNDMTGDIYDLLMGHEISHALHTPLEGWHDTLSNDKKRPKLKSFLNVCEDARIEKLIKRKYPGIRKPFSEAYKLLMERDFFKVQGKSINEKQLIDRINLFFKVGAHLNIPFSEEEQKFVVRAENLETFEQTSQLARDIYDYQKQKNQNKKKQDKQKDDKSKDNEKSSGRESGDPSDVDESDDDLEDYESGGNSNGNGNGASSDDDEPTSETDTAFREREQNLINPNGTGVIYLSMPDAVLKNIIIPHNIILSYFEIHIKNELSAVKVSRDFNSLARGMNSAFHARNRGFISMMVKEFEMRKNANQYARQLVSKTGELDDKKISRYKVSSDIFRKVTTVTKGKSHGMVMFLDLSGSMSDTLREIIEQILVLTTFCKRVGIPFDVYGFGDTHNYTWERNKTEQFKVVNNGFSFRKTNFCLRHLISSKLRGSAYNRAFTMLNVVGQLSNSSNRDPAVNQLFTNGTFTVIPYKLGFGMAGTPLMETIVASKEIINSFKNQHHCDIVNVIYLTDGDGNHSIDYGPQYDMMTGSEKKMTTIGFNDFKTKVSVLTKYNQGISDQAALTKLVRVVTACRHIGYYFADSYSIEQIIILGKNEQEFLRNYGFITKNNIGYDNYYYLDLLKTAWRPTNNAAYQGLTSPEAISHMFNSVQQKKKTSKLIAKQFAIDVAE